ncbi:MAG: fused MFS/spermidine synthase [Candidatus Omnitrophica bacterium]|nr:fused MFS/spermidine synthase [Candidatus Omnitrophota bacterium]
MFLLILITFFSAFLLFQIELIIAKLFLPQYGGSYLVWGACIVFFQGALLAGYVFAHTFLRRLGTNRYLVLHLGLLVISSMFFPLRDIHLSFSGVALPLVLDIFWRLTVTIGPVFFVLSTMSLVTQSWLGCCLLQGRDNPYVLYAYSNAGSFAGLLTYPFIFERYLTNTEQLQIWRVLYLVLFLCNMAAWLILKRETAPQEKNTPLPIEPVSAKQMGRWLCLGAAGVVMFLSVTTIITYEVAPVPLLWIAPLGIYLLAFIFNFKKNPWCPSWIVRYIGPIIGFQAIMYFLPKKHLLPIVIDVILYCVFLFLVCLYTQNQLIQSKPSSKERMTLFYVMISVGGFLGGIVTSWIIPIISNSLIEYLAGLFVVALMVPSQGVQKPWWQLCLWVLLGAWAFYVWPHWTSGYHLWSFVLLWVLVGMGFKGLASHGKGMAIFLAGIIVMTPFLESVWQNVHFIVKKRNYYGIYEIYDAKSGLRVLVHGTTLHGMECLRPDLRKIPLGYYSPISPIGTLLISDVFKAQRVGVVGLGTGALSMYSKLSCPVDYYELDGDVKKLALDYFWYLSSAPGEVHVILGDARLSLRQAPDGVYDLLVIDAFSGDAIPSHLVNKDVLKEYRQKLTPRGGVVFHITNRYLNLEPVLARIASDCGAYVAIKDVGDSGFNMRSIWCILVWDEERFLKLITKENWQPLDTTPEGQGRLWSDDYSSILPIINMNELVLSLHAFKPWAR